MNRSVLLETLEGCVPARRGALIVARSWMHPDRGRVGCPAHPAVIAAAEEAGLAVQAWDLGVEQQVSGETTRGEGTIFAVSYEDPGGGFRGLAVAAHRADFAARAWAGEEIASWRSVMRTRRTFTLDPADGPAPRSGDTAAFAGVFPAQPEPQDSAWAACGCATQARCPAAGHSASAMRSFRARGDEVVLVGEPVWGSGVGVPVESGGGESYRVRSVRDAEALTACAPERLAFVVAPGSVSVEVARLLAVLRRRFPRLRGQHPDQWCYTMTDLLSAARSSLAESDVLLLAGAGASPVTAAAQAAAALTPVHRISALGQLRPRCIDVATLTIADCGARLGGQVLQVLSGLGPLGVLRRATRTESVPVASPVGGEQTGRVRS
ncbi:4-hydroxy-3-methylbut-2-enyl diphosphate reductase [Streptomyces sp. NBC_00212]|uniref:4-hydroxy-3-methylbut-2-enyl diphosphate reductase n=1 Tax=Streptomyces sp. NBC_00212 TaxID=2975684 RepID=UPI003246CAC4